jgi:hypothetical protein
MQLQLDVTKSIRWVRNLLQPYPLYTHNTHNTHNTRSLWRPFRGE